MTQTSIPVGDPRALKAWSTALALDTSKLLYWSKFIGEGDQSIIQRKTELEKGSGDTVQYDLNMRLRGGIVTGDDRAEGKEEALTFLSDELKIDQARKPVSGGGRMTAQRTIHNLRQLAKDRGAEYMAEWQDDLITIYLSGDSTFSAINQDSKVTAAFAGNAITPPDSAHLTYAKAATSKASLVVGDTLNVQTIERISVKPEMMNATDPNVVRMSPAMVEGAKKFVLVMNPFQAYDVRVETGDLSWSKIAQAAATAEGRNSPIFKGGLGMINNVILHEHTNIRRFSDYGAGANVQASRALFLGRQAGMLAYGQNRGRSRMIWEEEMQDYGNLFGCAVGAIMGFKKTTFEGRDFGVVAIDSAARDPNP